MPELRKIPLADIDAPVLPARVSMDEKKMQDLVESMREIGLLQPIGLKPVNGRWEIEFGHRRYMAACELQWREIPALCFTAGEILDGAAMLAENVVREDLNAAEEAILFAQSREKFGLDEAGLVQRFRRSADYIADRLRLLRDDPEVFNALLHGRINFSVARELNKCHEEAHRRMLLDAAIRADAGQRTVTGWVQQWRVNTQPAPTTEPTTVPSTVASAPVDPGLACCMCGGMRDPWNMVNVYIHKWELDAVRKALNRPLEEEECESGLSETQPAG